jgi:succinyl-diaminopimelate desuccinylase
MSDGVDPVALARALIRCRSVTPADDGALDALQTALEALGFACRRMPFGDAGRDRVDNLYARIGEGAPLFWFAGHTDVVPPGDAGHWSVDPFAGTVRDGLLYGRGAADMKGAVAAFVAGAARFLEARGRDFGGAIGLAITGDEEGDAVNGTARMLLELAALGERPDACLVGEPSNPDALGDAVKIGRRGSLNAWITAFGTQGHVAYPDRADNAAHRMIRLLAPLTAAPLDELLGVEPSPHFLPSNLTVTTIDVGNPATNVVPAEARAHLNIRYTDRHTAHGLEEWLRAALAAADDRHELTIRRSGDSFLTPPGRFTELVAGAAERVLGRRPAYDTSGGTSDARFIKDLCPVVEFGLVSRTIHQVDEHAAVDDLVRLTEIYATILERFFAGQD